MNATVKSQSGTGKKRKKLKLHTGWISLIAIVCAAFLVIGYLVLTEKMEKRTYPLFHTDIIVKEAAAYELDPYFVAAVIYCESSGRETVVSHKGATGLMQIMPKTGEWIAEKLEMDDYSEERLKEPEVNIRMGCWYLSYLFKRYEGNSVHALAAYNAGPGNVSKWLEDPQYTQDGQLTDIPFDETAAYVKKVLAAQEKYRELYEEELR